MDGNPSASSCSYAWTTIQREQSSCSLSARLAGSRTPLRGRPLRMASRKPFSSWRSHGGASDVSSHSHCSSSDPAELGLHDDDIWLPADDPYRRAD